MAKDFSEISTGKQETGINTGTVYSDIERGREGYRAQPTASLEEQEQRKASGRTQGRKGCAQPRINTAFTSDNYRYICVMSKVKGQTMTQFINGLIAADRKKHAKTFDKAVKLLEEMEAE